MYKALSGALCVVFTSIVLIGCSASTHMDEVRNADSDRITVGTVQKEITIGMSAADVAAALGSPNIVTTDEMRREVWIYDKISTEVAYSRSGGSIVGLVVGGSAGGLAGGSRSAGASSQSQRTLTVIIKFDSEARVRDFSYRTSSF